MKRNLGLVLSISLLAFIVLYFFFLGNIGLLDVDEPRYAEAGREMLESGDWIVPYFNYVVRYDKPVFFYWLEALSMAAFGVNEFSARLPSVLCALICVYFLYTFLNRFYGSTCALIGSLILMSSLEFAALARFSVTDMTLSCFISSAFFCFFLGYDQILNSHKVFKHQIKEFTYWYLLGFIFLACAFLTKGPVSIVLVSLTFLPFFWWIGKTDYFLKSKAFWVGFLLFIALILPWYIAVHNATNGDFTNTFFGLHNFDRYTKVVSGHKGNYFYFIPVVLIGFLPWIFFLPQSIWSLFKRGLRVLQTSSKDQVPWFCFWWFLVIFLFFSVSKTKLLTYILPVFPALSILVAIWFDGLIKKGKSNLGVVIGLGVFFLICIILLYVCLFQLNIIMPRELKTLKLDFQILTLAFLLFVGVSMAWASSQKDLSLTFTIILSTFFLTYFLSISLLLPKIDKHSQYLLRTFAKDMPRDVEISTYQIVKPSLTFYAKRKIGKIDNFKKLQERINSEKKFAFVTKKTFLEGKTLINVSKWGSDNRYVFYTNYGKIESTKNNEPIKKKENIEPIIPQVSQPIKKKVEVKPTPTPPKELTKKKVEIKPINKPVVEKQKKKSRINSFFRRKTGT